MPLNFAEDNKPPPPVDFFVTDTKARPLDLEGEVLPQLIQKCGDVKSGRITAEMVCQYLDKNVLVFDRDLVKSLFAEADFRKEGSLDARALKAALSARFPKRMLHKEWRQLTALLLNTPELVLADDVKHPKIYEGTFNHESVWDSPPRELPKVSRRRKPKAKPVSGDWKEQQEKQQQQQLQPLQGTSSSLASTGKSTLTLPPAGTLRTAGGLKQSGPTGAEVAINSTGLLPLGGSGRMGTGTGLGRSTFEGVKAFSDFSEGLSLTAVMSEKEVRRRGDKSVLEAAYGSGKPGIRAWSATLPPSPITMNHSALQTLRTTVRSTITRKPEFVTMHPPLTTSELDLKKTLGQPMDVTATLSRVEPVRPTKVLPQADYMAWSDFSARTCRTAPTRWFNEHPAAPAPPKDHNYPW